VRKRERGACVCMRGGCVCVCVFVKSFLHAWGPKVQVQAHVCAAEGAVAVCACVCVFVCKKFTWFHSLGALEGVLVQQN